MRYAKRSFEEGEDEEILSVRQWSSSYQESPRITRTKKHQNHQESPRVTKNHQESPKITPCGEEISFNKYHSSVGMQAEATEGCSSKKGLEK